MESSAIGGFAQGLNTAINQYFNVGINNMSEQAKEQRTLNNGVQLHLATKAIDAAYAKKDPTISFGNLKTANPKLGALGLADDYEIPLSALGSLASILPKDGRTGAGADKFANLDEAKGYFTLLGIPEAKYGKQLADMKAKGIDSIPFSLIDDISKANSKSSLSLDSAFRLVSQSMSPDDPGFGAAVKKLQQTASVVGAGEQSLPDAKIPDAVKLAQSLFEQRLKENKGNAADALGSVADQMHLAYTAETSAKVLQGLDDALNPPKQYSEEDKKKHVSVGSLLQKLLGIK